MQNLNRDLAQFLEQLKARGVSANTQKAYSSDINDLLVFLSDTKQQLDLEHSEAGSIEFPKPAGPRQRWQEKPRRLKTSLLGGLILAALI